MAFLDEWNKRNSASVGGAQLGTSRSNKPSFVDMWASRNDKGLKQKLASHYLDKQNALKEEERKKQFKRVESLLSAGKSWEDIAGETGLDKRDVERYSKATRPDYGVKGPGLVEKFATGTKDYFVGLGKDIGKNVSSTVGSVVKGERKGPGAEELVKQQAAAQKLPKDILEKARSIGSQDNIRVLDMAAKGKSVDEIRKYVDEAAKRKAEADKKTLATATEVATMVAAPTSLTNAFRQGGTRQALKTAATTTTLGAAGNVSSELRTNPNASAKELRDAALVGGAFGLGADVVAAGAGGVVRGAKNQAIDGVTKVSVSRTTRKLNELTTKLDQATDPKEIAKLSAQRRNFLESQSTKNELSVAERFNNAIVDRLFTTRRRIKQALESKDINSQNYLDKLDYATGNVRRSSIMAEQYMRQNGFEGVMQQLGTKTRENEFSEYLLAKQREFRRVQAQEQGRELSKGFMAGSKRDQKVIASFRDEYEELAQQLHQYSQGFLREMSSPTALTSASGKGQGIISPELAESLIRENPEYIPLSKVLDELDETGGGGTSSVGSLSKQSVVYEFKGADGMEMNPLQAIYEKTQVGFNQIARNETAQLVRSLLELPGNPLGIKVLRSAEDVNKRIELKTFLKESRPVANMYRRLVSSEGRFVRRLESELSQLNKLGLDEYLKSQPIPKREIKLSSKTTLLRDANLQPALEDLRASDKWKVGQAVSPEVAKSSMIDTIWWNQAKGEATERLKAYAKKNKLTEDQAIVNQFMKRLGFDEYAASGGDRVLLSRRKVEKRAVELVGSGKLESKVTKATSTGSAMSSSKTRAAVENLIAQDTATLRAIHRKIAKREPKLARAIESLEAMKEQMDEISRIRKETFYDIRKLADETSRGKATISLMNNGVKEIIEVPEYMEKALKGLNSQQGNALVRGMFMINRIRKFGFTGGSPGFATRNLPRDIQFKTVVSRSGFKTLNPVDVVGGFVDAISSTATKEQAERFGAFGNLVDTLRGSRRSLDTMRSSGSKTSKVAQKITSPKELFQTLEDVVSITETSSRAASFRTRYKEVLKATNNEQEALLQATLAARRDSTDFFVAGEWGDILKGWGLYLNPSIQGTRRLGQALKETPVQTSARLAVVMLGPSIATTYWNMSDEKRRQAYDDIPQWEKDANFIIVGPNPRYNESTKRWDGVYKIPKAPGIREIGNASEDLVRKSFDEGVDIGDFVKELGYGVIKTVTPEETLAGAATPDVIEPVVQQVANKNFFSGKEIVPEDDKYRDAKEQYSSPTAQRISELLKKAGKDVSPLRVDALIRDYTGSAGQGAQNLVERAVGADTPGGRSFGEQISQSFFGAVGGVKQEETTKTFGELYDNKSDISAQITDAVKRNDIQAATRLASEYNNRVKEFENTVGGDKRRRLSDKQKKLLESLLFPVKDGKLSDSSISYRRKN